MKQTVREAAKTHWQKNLPDTDILHNVSKATFEADVDDNHSIRHGVVAWLREKKRYNNNMECTSNSSAEYEDITHWMPIPSFDEILEANKDVLKRIKENYKEPEKINESTNR